MFAGPSSPANGRASEAKSIPPAFSSSRLGPGGAFFFPGVAAMTARPNRDENYPATEAARER
jgi:hypothetical protein